jgi:hypothetical protein
LTWKKENEGRGPTGHREIGEGGDHAGAGSATEAQFQSPRANGVKQRGEKW